MQTEQACAQVAKWRMAVWLLEDGMSFQGLGFRA